MREERKRILRMLEEGKITSEEAEKLLDAIEKDREASSGKRARWMRVKVTEGDKTKVNINLPISLIRALLKITGKFHMKFGDRTVEDELKKHGVEINNIGDLDKILNEFSGDGPYKLLDVDDEGEHVEIYID